MRVSTSRHPHQHLLSAFLITPILEAVKRYLTVVLICISLMTSDTEHLFMYLLDICISFLEKVLFSFFGHILIGLSFYYFLNLFFYRGTIYMT